MVQMKSDWYSDYGSGVSSSRRNGEIEPGTIRNGLMSLTRSITNRLIMIGFGWIVALAVSRILAIIFISSEQFVFFLIGALCTFVGVNGIVNDYRSHRARPLI
jgi:1,4-dihydroxy-2-naphthoate octaprenyltransferase